ncbi:MAG: P1 family peptidase [Actinobacteria bacterium]|nr:P1 family peptidase [Actinomycetota bacterium]
MTALGIDGLRVGMWTAPEGTSGCTVLLPPDGSLGAVAVRGASPGTREAVALGPTGKMSLCHAVVLSGGSAYGLASADGVMRWCEEHGIGYPTRIAIVPIVGAAIVLDQGVATPAARPGPEAGYAACEAAVADDPAEGAVGAGRGTTVAKVAGLEHCWRGGQGIAVRRHGDLVVGALVVNNAVGEVRADDGTWLARARVGDDVERFPYTDRWFPPREAAAVPGGGPTTDGGGPTENTVIGCIVTNARLSKTDAVRVADLGHTGIARSVWPAHTQADGDALFCLATHEVEAAVDLVATLAADAVAEATRRGPLLAEGHSGLPGLADG